MGEGYRGGGVEDASRLREMECSWETDRHSSYRGQETRNL